MTSRTIALKTLRDGTVVMMAGTLLAGFATYAWQAAVARSLGEDAFAPVASVWTLMFLIVTVLLAPVEQFAIRTVASGKSGRAQLAHALPTIGVLSVLATVAIALGSWLARDSLFHGEAAYVPVCAAIVLAFGQLAFVRGVLAGQRNFKAYGYITALDSLCRLAVGIPLLLVGASALTFAWTIPACALTALLWAAHQPRPSERVPLEDPPTVGAARFIAHTVGGTAAAQVILASGPLVLALLGGSPAAVTTLFAAQTAFRAAFMVATPGWSRVLPALTAIAMQKDFARLSRLAGRLLAATSVGAVVGGVVSALLAPPLLAIFYGQDIRPSAFVAGMCGAGTVIAIGNLGLTQILVARVRTRRITGVWWIALAGSVLTLLLVGGTPTDRVLVAFVVGESLALVGLTLAASRFFVRDHEIHPAGVAASSGAIALPAEPEGGPLGVPTGSRA